MEIHRLHEMLTEAGIDHEFLDRGRGISMEGIDFGYQVIVRYPDGERMISAIEGYGTYGYRVDLIEIMGLLTPEEEKDDSVVGYLTAEEVFRRIKEAVAWLK